MRPDPTCCQGKATPARPFLTSFNLSDPRNSRTLVSLYRHFTAVDDYNAPYEAASVHEVEQNGPGTAENIG
jgi:hypothetical protein